MLANSAQIKRCKQALEDAGDYESWRQAALELDRLEYKEEWKADKASPDYDYSLIQQRLNHLRNCREANDYRQLLYSLRESLQRGLGNLNNPALYANTNVGTKYLIDDYIEEIVTLLKHFRDSDIRGFSLSQKVKFFNEIHKSYGRTALMLSGGANFGLYHMGIVKALWERNLMPRVISGSSAGAIVTGIMGTFSDEDLETLFSNSEKFDLRVWRVQDPRSMWGSGSLMDNRLLEHYLQKKLGEYTFQEAHEKTGRIINISVSPVLKNQNPRLLNYLSTPNILVRSAVLASCAVPGLFPPVTLTAKDRKGRYTPYMSSVKWADGSLRHDIPFSRLSELHNATHYIVSQTNPHILPFLERNPSQKGLKTIAKNFIKSEIQFRGKQIINLLKEGVGVGIVSQLLQEVGSILQQNYSGHITIHPRLEVAQYFRLLSNPTVDEIKKYVSEGERATWPKLSVIENQTKITQTIEDSLRELRAEEHATRFSEGPFSYYKFV